MLAAGSESAKELSQVGKMSGAVSEGVEQIQGSMGSQMKVSVPLKQRLEN